VTEVRTLSKDVKLIKERRQYIANNALKVFLRKGYEKATMRDLADACNMAPSSLYHYIGSKADIIGLIIEYHPKTYRRITQNYSELANICYTDLLREYIAILIQTCDEIGYYILFFYRELHQFSQNDRHRVLGFTLNVTFIFEELLRKGIDAGEFRSCDPTLLSQNIMMLGHAWILRGWYFRQHYTLEEYIEKQAQQVLASLRLE